MTCEERIVNGPVPSSSRVCVVVALRCRDCRESRVRPDATEGKQFFADHGLCGVVYVSIDPTIEVAATDLVWAYSTPTTLKWREDRA